MSSKDSASPRASFILTRKYFFIVSFTSIYILLSRCSNNRNLNLCLPNKYLFAGLVFLNFQDCKKIFSFNCFYVGDNRVFSTWGRPTTSLKFAHSRPVRLSPHQIFIPFTKSSSPPLTISK